MVIVPTGEPEDDNFFPKPCFTGSIYITMQHVDELWEAVKDKAIIKTPVCDREYGMRDFSILDNNGYEIIFGEDISNRQQQIIS